MRDEEKTQRENKNRAGQRWPGELLWVLSKGGVNVRRSRWGMGA